MNLPKGFTYASLYAGIRKKPQTGEPREDVALICSETVTAAAGVFTINRVKAAPVVLSRKHLDATGGQARAILINAGNANCATRTGEKVALASAAAVGKAMKIPVEQVLVASTGVIGVELPPKFLTASVPLLTKQLAADQFDRVANAIMTTDTRPKTASVSVKLPGGTVMVAGMTKGSGMIHPGMATTLAFVMTDAKLGAPALRSMLKKSTETSFHRLTVDGDMSTNDTIFLLANGASGVALDAAGREAVGAAITAVLEDLARQIARDGEGATRLVTIDIEGAVDDAAAARIARSIANSPLVKTAIAGCDPNWGRILCAAGYSGAAFDPGQVTISVQGTTVCRNGLAARFSEEALKNKMNAPDCGIRFVIAGGGAGKARFWTCDFTYDYIKINASYRT